jgi:tetratricopeptide (TPR) repeat protein
VDTINNNDGFGIVVFLIILSVLELILSAILGFALYDFTWTRVNAERLIADYTEAIRLDPNNVELYYERAKVYSNKNDYTQAIADYTEAIRLDPNYMPAYLNRGSVHEEKKDYNRAIADYTEAVRLAPKDKDCKLSLKNARKKRGW